MMMATTFCRFRRKSLIRSTGDRTSLGRESTERNSLAFTCPQNITEICRINQSSAVVALHFVQFITQLSKRLSNQKFTLILNSEKQRQMSINCEHLIQLLSLLFVKTICVIAHHFAFCW